ncbi:MAG: molybdopterin biosynthesis protein [Desulfovibrio sp.]
MTQRNIYLATMSPAKAVATIKMKLNREELIRTEAIPTQDSDNRITAAPIYAKASSPTFHSAAMDGIAVTAEETFTAREGQPLTLTPEQFHPINTGHPLPTARNAVIMIEHITQLDDGSVQIQAPAFPWQHVRRIGEDIVTTELLLPAGHSITPYDIGALLSAGIFQVETYEQVKTVFIPTGDEVLDYTTQPQPKAGEVIESNSQVFAALMRRAGAQVTTVSPVKDKEEQLLQAVKDQLKSDAHIVVVGAGSSAGSKDFTRAIFQKLGDIMVHGISIMPGKPTLAAIADGKLLLGAPGYPVSAVVSIEEVLIPIMNWLTHRRTTKRQEIPVTLARKTPSRPGMEEMVRMAVGKIGEKYVGTPLGRGAGLLTSLTKAQAITRIPNESEGLSEGTEVAAELLVSKEELDSVLIHVGSHDNTLDLITAMLMEEDSPARLVSGHVGSMGGLTALKNGTALFAGCHLFDPETNDFNFPFLERYLPEIKVAVFNLAIRHQGLIVAKGNPLNINSIADLTKDNVRFINRQRGAGTRILFDHHLKKNTISADDINGYNREEYTHMSVAANVLTGTVDCGMGIHAAAKALNLDFVPLARERYDIIIPLKHIEDPRIRKMLNLVRTDSFAKKVQALGGYETSMSGKKMQKGYGLSLKKESVS